MVERPSLRSPPIRRTPNIDKNALEQEPGGGDGGGWSKMSDKPLAREQTSMKVKYLEIT
jgi:hypothetical protein